MRKKPGFTLAELLIALAILGVIATFTIPKVLQSQQDGRYNSIAKETAGTLSTAYSAYQQNNVPGSSTSTAHLTPYLNYVRVDTTSTIDSYQGQNTLDCSVDRCLLLHNGGMLWHVSTSFAGTASTSAIYFNLDPDGKVTDGTTNGPGKAVRIFIYYTGRVATFSSIDSGTMTSSGPVSPNATKDPPWFTWN